MKRFYYSAIKDGVECDGILRAASIDQAKEQLCQGGYEEITLSVLSSLPSDFDADELNQDIDSGQVPS